MYERKKELFSITKQTVVGRRLEYEKESHYSLLECCILLSSLLLLLLLLSSLMLLLSSMLLLTLLLLSSLQWLLSILFNHYHVVVAPVFIFVLVSSVADAMVFVAIIFFASIVVVAAVGQFNQFQHFMGLISYRILPLEVWLRPLDSPGFNYLRREIEIVCTLSSELKCHKTLCVRFLYE